jgi:hypothetical protein
MKCRHCDSALEHIFLDLAFAPPSNAYLSSESLTDPEKYFPLKVRVCECCWLVQTEDYAEASELFDSTYAYFSSTSKSWLLHAEQYAKKIIKELFLTKDSLVIEIASNDGYLLKNFLSSKIPCLGIEPTKSTAIASEKIGISVIHDFFTELLARKLASSGRKADLIIGNNVYAHVPNINDFTRGLKELLKPNGVVTLEFPHIMKLIENTQFDTIYHEHFSYLSLYTVNEIFNRFGLRVFDVQEISTHGGSIRVYGCHHNDKRQTSSAVTELLNEEGRRGLQKITTYRGFQERVNKIKDDLLLFLIEKKRASNKVVAYGAAAKGNTLLNYAGVKSDLVTCVFDAAIAKQFKFMPGSHIPILPPAEIIKKNPDYILILPWNIASEVRGQLKNVLSTHVKFVTAIPFLKIHE